MTFSETNFISRVAKWKCGSACSQYVKDPSRANTMWRPGTSESATSVPCCALRKRRCPLTTEVEKAPVTPCRPSRSYSMRPRPTKSSASGWVASRRRTVSPVATTRLVLSP